MLMRWVLLLGALLLVGCGSEPAETRAPDATPAATVAVDPVGELLTQACTVGTFGAVAEQFGFARCREEIGKDIADLCTPPTTPLPVEQLVNNCQAGLKLLQQWAKPTSEEFRYGDPQNTPEAEETPPAPPIDAMLFEEWNALTADGRADAIASVREELGAACDEAPAAIVERVDNWYEAFGTDRSVGGVLADICGGGPAPVATPTPLEGLDPNDPEECPPTGPMPPERRAVCGVD